MDFALNKIVAQTEWPVLLHEAKQHLRGIGHSCDDDLIERLIQSASVRFERMTGRALTPQTWLLEVDEAVRAIELPRPPLIEIVLVRSKSDLHDDWNDVDPSEYTIQENRTPARLTWRDEQPRFIQVKYRAGLERREDVPPDYRDCILQLVVFEYENPGDMEAKLPTALHGWITGCRTGTMTGYWYQ